MLRSTCVLNSGDRAPGIDGGAAIFKENLVVVRKRKSFESSTIKLAN